MPVTTEPELSAYERVGGAPAVKAVVDRFYQRVLADGELARYFADLDESGMTQLKRHQVAMVSQVLGGPGRTPGGTSPRHTGASTSPRCTTGGCRTCWSARCGSSTCPRTSSSR